jgi:hypothetical protein
MAYVMLKNGIIIKSYYEQMALKMFLNKCCFYSYSNQCHFEKARHFEHMSFRTNIILNKCIRTNVATPWHSNKCQSTKFTAPLNNDGNFQCGGWM